jgi:hypothetical protein
MAIIFAIFAVSRLILWMIGLVSLHLVPQNLALQLGFPAYSNTNHWTGLWLHWDSGWYSRIADEGYSGPFLTPGGLFGQAPYNFFPLMPFLTRLLSKLLSLPTAVAGILLANILLILAAVFLYKYVLQRFENRQAALLSVTTLMFFPGSFVFSSLMSEPLYLSLSLISFFYMEKGQYGRGAIAASLITITRSLGILFFFIFILHWLRKNHNLKHPLQNNWLSFLKILLIPLPVMIFMAFLLHKFGSAFAFSQGQTFFGRPVVAPLHTLAHYLFYFRNISDINGALVSLFAFSALSLLVMSFRMLTMEEIAYSLAGILIPLTTELASIVRYCDVIFPLFMLISLLCARHQNLGTPLIAALATINGLFMVFWVLGAPFYV